MRNEGAGEWRLCDGAWGEEAVVRCAGNDGIGGWEEAKNRRKEEENRGVEEGDRS